MSDQAGARFENAPTRQLKNGGEAAALLEVHFDEVDTDGSKTLTSKELHAFVSRSKGPAREAAVLVVENFADVSQLAVRKPPSMPTNEGQRVVQSYFKDEYSDDAISRKDLGVARLCYTNTEDEIKRLRRKEIKEGLVDGGAFGFLTACLGTLSVLSVSMPVLSVALGGGAAATGYQSYRHARGLWTSSTDEIETEIAKRRMFLDSWVSKQR